MAEASRVMEFHGTRRPLELRRYPLPHLAEGEVLVRITCCTLCGSDIHTYEGRRSTPCPTVLGHEILGRVAELPAGSAVFDHEGIPLEIGDRITWSVAAGCRDIPPGGRRRGLSPRLAKRRATRCREEPVGPACRAGLLL